MTRSLSGTELKRLHRTWRRQAPGRLALLLDSVATPTNVGSILRSAAALRVEDVWMVGQTPGPEVGGVRKTALGSDRYLTIHQVYDPADALAAATATGYRVVGIELADHAEPIHRVDLTGSVCLAVGHEDRGLSAPVLDGAAAVAYIPQLGRIGSLNVATAAALACYEARRQGWPEGDAAATGDEER